MKVIRISSITDQITSLFSHSGKTYTKWHMLKMTAEHKLFDVYFFVDKPSE